VADELAEPEAAVEAEDHQTLQEVATLADTYEDDYWINRTTDVTICGTHVHPATSAAVLKHEKLRGSRDECRHECRQTYGCNAWFWCDDDHGCHDWQSGLDIARGQCLVLTADPRPQPWLALRDVTEDMKFSSFHAGYVKDDMWLRPPEVTIVMPITVCKPEDPDNLHNKPEYKKYSHWLNQMSVANKQDHARLRGWEFVLEAVKDGRPELEVLIDSLNRLSKSPFLKYMLWMDVRSLIYRHQMTFPFLSRYERLGQHIAMYGDPSLVAEGDTYSFEPGVMLVRNSNESKAWLRSVYDLQYDELRLKEGHHRLQMEGTIPFREAMTLQLMDDNQTVVQLETKFCMACYWENVELEAPTGFAAYFGGGTMCNAFAMAKDKPEAKTPYNKKYVNTAKLSRCKHSFDLELSEPRFKAEGLKAKIERVHMQAYIIQPGTFNHQPDANACRKQCRGMRACNAWMFCSRPGGCDDGYTYRPDWYPQGACELFSMPHKLPMDLQGKGPLFSSSSHGFLPKKYSGHMHHSAAELKMIEGPPKRPRKHPNVLIATAIPSDPCPFPVADFINKLAMANKHDYAHRHSFELHISAEMIDPNVTAGNWNKLTMIRKLLDETPRSAAEWIMWMDSDTLLFNSSVLPRFKKYKGKDLVVWGQEELLKKGDLNQGMNTGVLLIRNTDWSRQYMADVGQYAYVPQAQLHDDMLPILKEEVYPLVSGFYDTPFFVWLLKTQEKYFSKVFFEDQISINKHWLGFEYATEDVETLVMHYAGCTICKPPENKLTYSMMKTCTTEFFKAYSFSRCNLGADYTGGPPCPYEDSQELKKLAIRLGQ